ncbi:MAG: acyl-CoA thioesterase [Bacteroidetes bacterium]|nr:acyl-CoA thioesterase [Bacteroidota bacterium]
METQSIVLPKHFNFTFTIPIRITDVNYSNHVGNDSILSIIHEARMLFLAQYGYSELSFETTALIMRSVAIEYKAELFYGDRLEVSVTARNFSKLKFEIVYKLEKCVGEKRILAAKASTIMACFDYDSRKLAHMPDAAMAKMSGESA